MKKIFALIFALCFSFNLAFAETVSFNVKTLKYHKITCASAKKCKNCIKIDKKEAIKRGGVPCKNCF